VASTANSEAKTFVMADSGIFDEKLPAWEDFHSFSRPHSGLSGQRLRTKTTIRAAK
jgi:hypothetical protein